MVGYKAYHLLYLLRGTATKRTDDWGETVTNVSQMRRPEGPFGRVTAPLPADRLEWGRVEARGTLPPVAGRPAGLAVRVTTERPLPAGTAVEAWLHFVSDMGPLQVEHPDRPAYFSCSWEGRCEIYSHGLGDVHGAGTFFPYRRFAGVRLPDGAPEGETLALHFRDVPMQTYADDAFNLRIALLDGDELLGYFGDALYRVVGGPARSLRVSAPTVVEPGERFDAHVLAHDGFRNPSGDTLRPDDLVIDGGNCCYDTVEDRPGAAALVRGVRFEEPGVAYLSVRDGSTGVRGNSNPVVVRREARRRVFWGDIHQHACFADGRAAPAASYRYGKRVARLDFGSVAPHVMHLIKPPQHYLDAPPQQGWPEVAEATREATDDAFSALAGYEAGVRQLVGDMNVYLSDLDAVPVEVQMGRRPEDYADFVRRLRELPCEVLLLPHAHAGGGPGRFEVPELPDMQTSVELVSVHGAFPEFYDHWLKAGHRVGVHGAGDNHMPAMGNASPGAHYVNTNGLTAAVAPENTPEQIWRAFRERRTWAVTGNRRIYLDFSVDGSPMGSVVSGGGQKTIRLQAAGTAPLTRIELRKNSETLRTWRPELSERRRLRLHWSDTWPERRTDDSLTTGRIEALGAEIRALEAYNRWNRTDTVEQEGGAVQFRTSAYSRVPRGVLLAIEGVEEADGGAPVLEFHVRDRRWELELLEHTFRLPLDRRVVSRSRPLQVPDSRLRQQFVPGLLTPEFRVESGWVQPDWPRSVELEWTDRAEPGDYYYVVVEQLDCNYAWSSPVWVD